MQHNVSSVIGVDYAVADTTQRFAVGTTSRSNKGGEFIYLKAATAVTGEGYSVLVDADLTCNMVTSTVTNSRLGDQVAIAQCALSAGQWGWFQIDGACDAIRVSASCAAQTRLNTTATAGQLDDDGTANAEVIEGITIDTAAGGAAAVVAGFLRKPVVGATL